MEDQNDLVHAIVGEDLRECRVRLSDVEGCIIEVALDDAFQNVEDDTSAVFWSISCRIDGSEMEREGDFYLRLVVDRVDWSSEYHREAIQVGL